MSLNRMLHPHVRSALKGVLRKAPSPEPLLSLSIWTKDKLLEWLVRKSIPNLPILTAAEPHWRPFPKADKCRRRFANVSGPNIRPWQPMIKATLVPPTLTVTDEDWKLHPIPERDQRSASWLEDRKGTLPSRRDVKKHIRACHAPPISPRVTSKGPAIPLGDFAAKFFLSYKTLKIVILFTWSPFEGY
jgi:hypothetical protein